MQMLITIIRQFHEVAQSHKCSVLLEKSNANGCVSAALSLCHVHFKAPLNVLEALILVMQNFQCCNHANFLFYLADARIHASN